MGNKLVEAVKTVIRPIDYYLRLIKCYDDFHYKCSLGQTQFLKVAHCQHHIEGDVVIKVLPRKDRSLLLEPYREQLLELASLTNHNVSIISFKVVEINMDFVYAIRQYVRYSLYDRLSTRPFLIDLEKYWIVYQLLQTLDWLHSKNIQHGDLKLENIMITSNLWMILTDFAPFKPVFLPEDDPSIFNYYYDISRRRCCNLAPERFLPSIDDYFDQPNLDLDQKSNQTKKATNPMDMFSFGCIMAEIFAENFLFDLGDLLKFKHQQNCDRIFGKIDAQIQNESIRLIIKNLINLDPTKRKTAKEVLLEMRQRKLFPAYFDEFYALMINLTHLKPDPKILYLSRHLDHYLNLVIDEDPTGVLLLLMTITTSMRSLQHVHCRLEAQRLIAEMVRRTSTIVSPFIIDRLIPYLMIFLNEDQNHLVRARTIDTLADLLEHVETVPPNDSNIFLDYIMEKFEQCLCKEKCILVRIRMATNLNRFVRVARRFLLQSCDLNNLNSEMDVLQKCFQTLISTILTDPDVRVRRSLFLMPESCAIFCGFLGPTKTIETILSHMVTFLNEKKDFQLRLLFFETIPMVGTFLGHRHGQYSTMLYPFIQQGLYDVEEFCTERTIRSITVMIEQGLLSKTIVFSLFQEILPFVYHPNPWIRNAIDGFFRKLVQKTSMIDLHYKLNACSEQIIGFDPLLSTSRLLTIRPLDRKIYDMILLMKHSRFLQEFFQSLTSGKQPGEHNTNEDNAIMKRLIDFKFDLNDPNNHRKLSCLGDLLQKIHQNIQRHRNLRTFMNHDWSIIIYQELDQNLRSRSKQLPIQSISSQDSGKIVAKLSEPIQCPPHLASIGDLINHKHHQQRSGGFFFCRKNHNHNSNNKRKPPTTTVGKNEFHVEGKLFVQLYEHKRSVNSIVKCEQIFITCSDDGSVRVWDHLQQQISAENNDGDGRIKSNQSLDELRPSIASYQHQYGIRGMIICCKYLICWSTEDFNPSDCYYAKKLLKTSNFHSKILIFELSSMLPLCFLCSFDVPGLITSLCKLNEQLFAVSTSDSRILIYDCRTIANNIMFNVPVIKLNVPMDRRFITTMDGGANGLVLFAATAGGYVTGFDLRFQMNIVDWQHEDRIHKIRYCDRGLFTSVGSKITDADRQQSAKQQLMLWDYKLAEPSVILTSSIKPIAENQNHRLPNTPSIINAILPIQQHHNSMIVLTGGSDSQIRCWNLDRTESSYLISGVEDQKHEQSLAGDPSSITISSTLSCVYRERRVGAIRYIDEEIHPRRTFHYNRTQPDLSNRPQQMVSVNHQDSITDLINIDQYLVSAGRNGIVKIWK